MKEAEVNEINTEMITDTDSPIRLIGTIIHVDPKGFGFINSKEKPFTRIFFHWQALHYTIDFMKLKKGDKVSFELKQDEDNGYRAIRIDLINE